MEDLYIIDQTVSKLDFNGLQNKKLPHTFGIESILISLEKGHLLPEHKSPKDANIYMIEGSVIFYINGNEYNLNAQEWFRFPKDEVHSVRAIENSKFFVLR